MRLTKKIVDQATYEGNGTSRHVLWDDSLPGFGVRIYPTGRKSFILSYRNAGRRKRLLTIGAYGALTLTQARQLAREHLVDIARGGDPVGDRKEVANEKTFNDLAALYMEQHAKIHKKSWEEDARYIRVELSPRFGTINAKAVTTQDVAGMHLAKSDAPYAANRALEVIQMIYVWGKRAGLLPRDHINPAEGVTPYKEKSRTRFLQVDEMPAFAEAVATLRSPWVQGLIWMYLFTGVRKSALMCAKWSHVDLKAKTLFVPDTKNGEPRTVPLCDQAVTILEELPREKNNPHVFCGRKAGSHIKCIQRSWEAVRDRSGLEDLRLHDLRRTVGSWMANDGVSLLVIGKTLGHQSTAATRVYARLNQDPVRKALDVYGEQIERAMAPTNIIELYPEQDGTGS